jgi:RNA 3'-terminal phosphate cyclase-like protein
MAERGGGGGRAAPRKRAKVGEVTSGTGGLPPLRFRGSTHFRQRVICALLSGRSIRIDDIRPSPTEGPGGSVDMGLLGYEASFLRLVDAITNGTEIDINESGTTLQLRPGFVTGGKVEHDCGTRRSIGWFLEGIIPLALFSKLPLHATLLGVTNDDLDWSVDTIRAITIPFLKRFGVAEEGGLGIKIVKRGAPPNGGGEVIFTCPISRQLTAMQLTDAGLVKRVRGNAYCTKVSPQMANRVAEATRGVLNDYLPDVWIHTDKFSGPTGGLSPGYGLALVAETTTGVLLGAETAAGQVGLFISTLYTCFALSRLLTCCLSL